MATNQASNTPRVLVNPDEVTLDGEIDIFDEFQVGRRFGEHISGEPADGNPDVARDGIGTQAEFDLIAARRSTDQVSTQ